MSKYRYLDTLSKIAELISLDAGFAGWKVSTGTDDLQPEQFPIVQVHEDTIESTPKAMPGYAAGNREITATYMLRLVTYNPADVNEARKQLQDGLDALEQFLQTQNNFSGMIDYIERVRVNARAGADLEGYVAMAEVTVTTHKLI